MPLPARKIVYRLIKQSYDNLKSDDAAYHIDDILRGWPAEDKKDAIEFFAHRDVEILEAWQGRTPAHCYIVFDEGAGSFQVAGMGGGNPRTIIQAASESTIARQGTAYDETQDHVVRVLITADSVTDFDALKSFIIWAFHRGRTKLERSGLKQSQLQQGGDYEAVGDGEGIPFQLQTTFTYTATSKYYFIADAPFLRYPGGELPPDPGVYPPPDIEPTICIEDNNQIVI